MTIESDRCKACRLCIDACPQHVLDLSPEYNRRGYHPVILCETETHCTGCAICALVCPDNVFTVYRVIPSHPRGVKEPAAA